MRHSTIAILAVLLSFSEDAFAQAAKPRVTVATIGHAGHGKSMLTSAITGVLSDRGRARFVPFKEVSSPSGITEQGTSVTAARVEYETAKARYVHIDCDTDDDVTILLAAKRPKLDGAILVVSAADGPMPQTREHIVMARLRGITSLIVFLNKVDLVDDPELLDLVELELRELLTANEYDGEAIPIIRGSALKALQRDEEGEKAILALLEEMDSRFVK